MIRKIILLLIIIFFFSFPIYAGNTLGQQIEVSKNNYVIAYYFHGNFRCANCRNIEQYSKEAIEKYFEDELTGGKVVFEVINVEEKDNQHFVDEYQLYTKSLVLSLVKDGREIKSKNLARVWEYLRDKPGFYQYVKEEVNSFLNQLDQ